MATKIKSKLDPPSAQPIETPPVQAISETAALPWLTLETGLYGLILLAGIALRLWNLGRYPLSGAEAEHSLAALRLYQGQPLDADIYSPLLVSLNSFIFLLFYHSDATARLVTVVLGSVLVILPLTFRRQLGRRVCLLASALLAISPSAVFLSRTINSEIIVAAGALMMAAGFFNWAETGRRDWLFLLAGGTAVLLTAGPMAYSIVLIFALVALAKLADFRTLWSQGLALAAQTEASAPANKSDQTGPTLPPSMQQAGIFLLVALILLATAATFNLSGLGVTTGLFANWLSRLGVQAQPNAGFNAVFLLTIYEPLLVVAGLVGLAFALLGGNLLRFSFAVWFVAALILDLLMGGRPDGNVILAVIPLAFLAASALAGLWAGLEYRASWSNEGVILASGLVIIAFGYIGLTGWLDRLCATDDTFCRLAWLQAVAALSLFGVIVAFFGFVNNPGVALRGAAITGVAVGLLATISIGWRLNFGPLMNLGYQPLAGIPASTELAALRNTLVGESTVRAGDKALLDILWAGPPNPALSWQLRDFNGLTQASSLPEAPTTSAVITPTPAANSGQEFNLGETYIGQDFAIDAVWSPVGLSPKDLIDWLIYREAKTRPDGNKIILWLRLNRG